MGIFINELSEDYRGGNLWKGATGNSSVDLGEGGDQDSREGEDRGTFRRRENLARNQYFASNPAPEHSALI